MKIFPSKVILGKNRLPFSLQLLWEVHTGFPTMDIATSLLALISPQGDSTKVPRAMYENVGFRYNVPSVCK